MMRRTSGGVESRLKARSRNLIDKTQPYEKFVHRSRHFPSPRGDWRALEFWRNGIANINQTLECNMQLCRRRQ